MAMSMITDCRSVCDFEVSWVYQKLLSEMSRRMGLYTAELHRQQCTEPDVMTPPVHTAQSMHELADVTTCMFLLLQCMCMLRGPNRSTQHCQHSLFWKCDLWEIITSGNYGLRATTIPETEVRLR